MKKQELTFLKFSPCAWKSGKISAFGAFEQGIFLNLCINAWNKQGEIDYNETLFAKQMQTDAMHLHTAVEQFKECGIIENNRIKFIDELLQEIGETSKLRKDAANKRWQDEKLKNEAKPTDSEDAPAMHMHTPAMQTDADKRREEEIREEKIRKDKNIPPKGGVGKDVEKPKKKQKNIIPPEIEWVKEYAKNVFPYLDAEEFMSWYETRGWKAGKDKMTNWQSAIVTWKKNYENKYGKIINTEPVTVIPQPPPRDPNEPLVSDEDLKKAEQSLIAAAEKNKQANDFKKVGAI